MANRYSLNLRPIYDQDEPTGGQRFASGISGAIDTYVRDQDARKGERMQMEEQGYMLDPSQQEQTGWDRLRARFRRRPVEDQLPPEGGLPGVAPNTPSKPQPITVPGPSGTPINLPDGTAQQRLAARGAPSFSDAASSALQVHGRYGTYVQNPAFIAAQRARAEDAERLKYIYEGEPRLRAEFTRFNTEQTALDRRERMREDAAWQRSLLSALSREGNQPNRAIAEARTSAETSNLAQTGLDKEADRVVESLHAQNPGRHISAEDAVQYLGGLQRNRRANPKLTEEHIYAALDRYHNPPNRPPTAAQSLDEAISQLGGQSADSSRAPVSRAGRTTAKPKLSQQEYERALQSGRATDSAMFQHYDLTGIKRRRLPSSGGDDGSQY